jgi:hypothetical protein
LKQTAPLLFGFVIGMVMFLQYFLPIPFFQTSYSLVLDWKQVVFGVSLMLGVVSLLRFHGRRVQMKATGWAYSTVALVGFVAVVGAALLQGTERGGYPWFFQNVQSPMQSTMFSLLAFYVASASYRAFRARTLQAALLLGAGVIVMLGRVPIGDFLSFHLGAWHVSVPAISTWILDVPNLAAKRGILIGVGLGITATALKILLGIERTYLGKSS